MQQGRSPPWDLMFMIISSEQNTAIQTTPSAQEAHGRTEAAKAPLATISNHPQQHQVNPIPIDKRHACLHSDKP